MTSSSHAQTLSYFDGGLAARLRGTVLLTTVFVCSFVFATIVCLLFPFVVWFDPQRHSLHAVAILWARTVVWLNPWWKFSVVGRENLPPDGTPVVFVSNHKSQTDILAMYLLGARFRWLSKDVLFRIPLFGWAMRAVGYVAVKRGEKSSHFSCMQESRQHLDKGTPMLFFPEGTRSKSGVLTAFKNGAFRLAVDAKSDVVPITLIGTETLLPKHSLLPNVTTVQIIVHPRISSLNLSVDALSDMARRTISAALPEDQRNERTLL